VGVSGEGIAGAAQRGGVALGQVGGEGVKQFRIFSAFATADTRLPAAASGWGTVGFCKGISAF